MNRRKALSLALGTAVSGVFLWMIFRALPLQDFLAAVARADLRWMLAGLAFFALGYACRIWRWRLMLAQYNARLSWGRCSVPFMVSIAANNVLPFRAGDVLRGVGFSAWLGVPTARVLATLLVERLLDLLSLIVALAVALTLFSGADTGVQSLLGLSASVFAAAGCAVAFVLLFPRVFEPPILWLLRALPARAAGLSQKLQTQVRHVFHTLSSLAEPLRMAVMMLWSFLAWTFEACVFFAVARALPDITAPVAAWVAMPVGTLSTMLPSTPGYIGTFHYFVLQAAQALGNPEIAAAAFAFLVHFALFIPATLWGGTSFVYWIFTRPDERAPLGKVTSTQ
ncbi:MAG: lysylphosphatidylglycerol synthase transmembrane domain-containing protein [Pseudomonadota bacterium]